ncbi:MAG: J domain-containing protein [Bacteroidetes bacterium]|nr:MAG: J domain-containing protein [Bacteroidota bacterium]
MSSYENFYAILGLPNFASLIEVKQAFKKMAFLYHPDKNPDNLEAEEKFKKINAVYQILGNPHKKAIYDQYLIYGITNPNPTAQNSVYETQKHYHKMPVKKRIDENWQATVFAFIFIFHGFLFLDSFSKINARIQFALATDFYKQAKYEKASLHLSSCLTSNEKYVRAHYLQGIIDLENLKYYKAAAESFEKAINYTEIVPLEYFLKRGIAYSHLQNKEKTKADFAWVYSQIGNTDHQLLTQMADAYFEATDFDNAMILYQKLDSLGFANKETYLKKSLIEKNNGNYVRAAQFLTKAIELDSLKANLYYERAMLYLQASEIQKTCADWQKAQSLDPFLKDASLDFFCLTDSTKN